MNRQLACLSEEVPAILDVIRQIKKTGNKTILLIEHKMDMILDLSDSIMVLFNGKLLQMEVHKKLWTMKQFKMLT